MKRLGHHLAGAVAGLAFAELAGQPATIAIASALVASAVAPLPDVDQRKWWAPLRRWRPLQHRRLTHWPGLPALASPSLLAAPVALRWLIAAMLIGWTSHLIGDWVFGRRGPASTGWRGPGIPFGPWWAYHGLGLACGGAIERYVAWPALTLVLGGEIVLMVGM